MTATTSPSHRLALGRAGLQQLHRSLAQHAGDQAVAVLQEAGFAAGEGLFAIYGEWLETQDGGKQPQKFDPPPFTQALAGVFLAPGWGAGHNPALGARLGRDRPTRC